MTAELHPIELSLIRIAELIDALILSGATDVSISWTRHGHRIDITVGDE